MDINGLVNPTNGDMRRFGSLSPPDHSVSSDSVRSQFPAESAIPVPSPYSLPRRDSREEVYSPHYQLSHPADRTSSPPVKRLADSNSPTMHLAPAKRKAGEMNGETNGKAFPTRRRALQACEACRAKKSKCDNERPSCGSCIQHGIDCVYKGAPFVPVLDAASMVLLEKLNKLETTLSDQSQVIARIQETTSYLEPIFPNGGKLLKSTFAPSQPRVCETIFQVPKGRWASLDYFMSLPFVKNLIPGGYKKIIVDNMDVRTDSRLPNLNKDHIQKLVDLFFAWIHPLHPIIEVASVERIKSQLDEDGLSWTGETAMIMHILAIGSILGGHDSAEYHSAAKRRMGFAIEKVDTMAIQANFLEGLYWHLLCQPLRAARSFHHASVNAYLYYTAARPRDRDYTDLEKRIFWECIKMETRYTVDVFIPDSGLACLDLITEFLPRNDGPNVEPAKRQASRFDLCLTRFAIDIMSIVYVSQYPNLQETQRLEDLDNQLKEWRDALHSPANELGPGPIKSGLDVGFESVHLLLHRPFLQYVLNQLTLSEVPDINSIPSSIASRAQKAIDIAVRHVALVRSMPVIDWFSLKQVLLAALFVLSVSQVMDDDVVTEQEVNNTLNGATEIFARLAQTSESAKAALQVISEIRVGLKRS